ncbi:DNA polymerase I [Corynebacterium phage EmiRose]|uniref:DNA polymerase n=1 Tax=Corynebacterium phage EmiRose TaxID=2565372 RepID=A0A649VP02_9CAUD|nr:DNA polymerase I [Corynebacterium phage EmiRose]QGJ94166.1 DNA polymerase I [Corynebacterium phage EmiRose]
MSTLLDLSRLSESKRVPSASTYIHALDANFHTGANAVLVAETILGDLLDNVYGRALAVDIETAGTGADSFTIKAVTFAWEEWGDDDGEPFTQTILLDPRDHKQAQLVRGLTDKARSLILHNAAFDWPVLVAYGLAAATSVDKVIDTLVMARMAFPDKTVAKSLTALVGRADLLDMADDGATMKDSFSAAGISTLSEGFATMDIDSPVYRIGAMADTVLTLRLAPVLRARCREWLETNPFVAVTDDEAYSLIEREQVTNRAMLLGSARGIAIDTDYLAKVTAEYAAEHDTYAATITAAGLDPEAGNLGLKVVEHLADKGELPSDWPMTATGKPKADKKAMELLDGHPLAVAHSKLAGMAKVLNYLENVDEYARVTGRLHPQVGILGASATGRMSLSSPALQQFPDAARKILVPDAGRDWVSIDWSSIEPVICANSARDFEFLQGFNDHGADLYAPIVETAHVDRKTAKVVLLAAMYGQGRALLASNLGVSEDEARVIQDRVFQAMPATRDFLNGLRVEGENRGVIMTADKRLLPIPRDSGGKIQGYKATNYYVQGSAYSVLSEAINSLYFAGAANSIILAMHDELVVDAEAADQVRKVMETPPEWLNDMAGRPVILRTDSNPLNGRWRYV